MTQTTQRRADYRARREPAGEDGDRRLDMWVSTKAWLALARLACYHSVSKREMLERLIVRADDAVICRLDPASQQWYFDAQR